MKAYNPQWIFNRYVLNQAERWHRQQLLTDAQIDAVRQTYPVPFRQTNGFLEIGLFLFTTVAILACYLLPASIFSMLMDDSLTYGLFNIAFGIGVGLVGLLMINRQQLYRNGVDNAFVAVQTGFLAFGLNEWLPNGWSVAVHCWLTLPLLLLVLGYYGDTLIAFFVVATFYTAVFDGLLSVSGGKDMLPFVMMGVSLALYALTVRINLPLLNRLYYADPLNLVQWLALIVLAAAGNYFVVRELNGLLIPKTGVFAPSKAPEIALPILFWLLTFIIPVTYLTVGLSRKNRMLIILGVIGLVGAVMTVHVYHALVPLNVSLTIGGAVLAGLAVALIRYLRVNRGGFTDAPDEDSPDELLTSIGTLTAIQAAGGAHHTPRDDMRFGGGNFGGSGSGGNY